VSPHGQKISSAPGRMVKKLIRTLQKSMTDTDLRTFGSPTRISFSEQFKNT